MNYYTDVLKKYAVFTGRARRKEFWMFVLTNLIVNLLLGMALGFTGSRIIYALSVLYALAILLPTIAVGVRRLHDTNRDGLWLLLWLIPLIGMIVLIVFWAMDSQPGSNKYGPNPKGIAAN